MAIIVFIRYRPGLDAPDVPPLPHPHPSPPFCLPFFLTSPSKTCNGLERYVVVAFVKIKNVVACQRRGCEATPLKHVIDVQPPLSQSPIILKKGYTANRAVQTVQTQCSAVQCRQCRRSADSADVEHGWRKHSRQCRRSAVQTGCSADASSAGAHDPTQKSIRSVPHSSSPLDFGKATRCIHSFSLDHGFSDYFEQIDETVW